MNNNINIQQAYNSAEARLSGFDGLGEIDVFETPFEAEFPKKKSKRISLRVTNNDASSRTALLFGFSKYINSSNFGNGNDITSWEASNSGIGSQLTIFALAGASSAIWASGQHTASLSSGVYLSNDNGATWTLKNTGLPERQVESLLVFGSYVFCGISSGTSGVFRTSNNGDSWSATSLTKSITHLLAIGSTVFAATNGNGVYRSSDNGDTWTNINTGLTNTDVYALAAIGTTLFAGTLGGVFRSTDNGDNWTAVNTGITDLNIGTLYADGTNLWAGNYAGGTVGIFLSTDNGDTWTAKNTGLTNYWVESFAKNGSTIYAATVGAGIFKSTNSGTSWTAINSGITDQDVYDLLIVGTRFFAATAGGGININDFVNLTETASLDGNFSYDEILSASALNPFTIKSINIRTGDASDASLPETIQYTHADTNGEIKTETIFIDDFLNEYGKKDGRVSILVKKKLMPIPFCLFPSDREKNLPSPSKQLMKVWLQYQMKSCNPKFMPEA